VLNFVLQRLLLPETEKTVGRFLVQNIDEVGTGESAIRSCAIYAFKTVPLY